LKLFGPRVGRPISIISIHGPGQPAKLGHVSRGDQVIEKSALFIRRKNVDTVVRQDFVAQRSLDGGSSSSSFRREGGSHESDDVSSSVCGRVGSGDGREEGARSVRRSEINSGTKKVRQVRSDFDMQIAPVRNVGALQEVVGDGFYPFGRHPRIPLAGRKNG